MKKLFLFAAVMLLSMNIMAQNANDVKTMIRNVNNAWQTAHPGPEFGGTKRGLSAFWDNAVYHTGNMEAYQLLRDLNWLQYAFSWADRNNWCGATEKDNTKWRYKNYGEGPQYVLFGDWQICFQTYLDLYFITGSKDKEFIERAKEVMGYEVHSDQNDYWWWADALYMVMPVMTKMYKATGDEAYLEKMYQNWKYANSIMYDEETGLYFRDGKYVYPKHKTAAGKKDFWARGDGWVMAAFAKVLKDLPYDNVHRKEFIQYYQKMTKGIVACQQEEGHWTRSMMDPEQAPGYETSGTALICYSLFWGINNGILSKDYLPAAKKAWNYLSTIALQPDNSIGYVQPIGEKAIPGQVVNQKSTSNFGTGAFLLAASEYVRFLEK